MNEIIKFNNKTWILSITRNMSFFHSCLNSQGYSKYSKKFNIPVKDELHILYNGNHAKAYFFENALPKYLKAIEDICSNASKINRLKKAYLTHGQNLLDASKKLQTNSSLTNYKKFIQNYSTLSVGLSLTSIIGRHSHEILKTELPKHFPNKTELEIDRLIGTITYPLKHTPLFNSQIELLAFATDLQRKKINPSNLQSVPVVNKFIKKYLNKYRAIPVNFNGEPWDEFSVIEQLGGLLKNDCKKELLRVKTNHNQKLKSCKQELSKIKYPKLKQIAKSTGIATILNEYRKFIFCNASLAYRPMFSEMAIKYNQPSWNVFWHLSPNEFESLYFKQNTKVLSLIKKREVAAVTGTPKGGYHILSPLELKSVLKQIKNTSQIENTLTQTEIKGLVANSGKVTGYAKIVINKNDFAKFKSEDILIAPMTSVDFIPLMQKAKAFVTNEGGLTSHAAIVSREMNKPCIIGTKIATKIFKDGDIIEVDANQGIVKKLK